VCLSKGRHGQTWTRTDYYYNASWQVIEERRVTGVAQYASVDNEPATAV
jgi:hypothetical protein